MLATLTKTENKWLIIDLCGLIQEIADRVQRFRIDPDKLISIAVFHLNSRESPIVIDPVFENMDDDILSNTDAWDLVEKQISLLTQELEIKVSSDISSIMQYEYLEDGLALRYCCEN